MRIALVTYALQVGGVETFLYNLANEFKFYGHEVDFVETESKGIWSDEIRELGFNVISVVRHPFYSRLHHAKILANKLSTYDALLINDSPLAMATLSMLPNTVVAIPILHTYLQSMIVNATMNQGQWQKVVTVAPGLCSLILNNKNINKDQVLCIPNGVETRNIILSQNKSNDYLKIVYAGRIEQSQKNVFAIPRILSLVKALGSNFTLDVIGDGPDVNLLKDQLRNAEFPYQMHGQLSHQEAMNKLAQADILLLPSFYEGLPIILLEAMARGVVPITSRLVGTIDSVINQQVNGIMVETDNEQQFAREIVSLSKSRNRLQQMSLEARNTVLNNYNVERMASSYLDLIIKSRNEIFINHPIRYGLDRSQIGDFLHTPYCLVRSLRKLKSICNKSKNKYTKH